MPRQTYPDKVTVHGALWDSADLLDNIKSAWLTQWTRVEWMPRPALIDKSSGKASEYVEQSYKPEFTTLDPTGWTHDHCCVCWWTITESDDPEIGYGYTDNFEWICCECYQQFIEQDLLNMKNWG